MKFRLRTLRIAASGKKEWSKRRCPPRLDRGSSEEEFIFNYLTLLIQTASKDGKILSSIPSEDDSGKLWYTENNEEKRMTKKLIAKVVSPKVFSLENIFKEIITIWFVGCHERATHWEKRGGIYTRQCLTIDNGSFYLSNFEISNTLLQNDVCHRCLYFNMMHTFISKFRWYLDRS